MAQKIISKRILSIGMVDADLLDGGTRHPNLAQMKMSKYCKNRGHNVRMVYKKEDLSDLNRFDLLLISKVFSFSKLPQSIQKMLPSESLFLRNYNLSVKNKVEYLEYNSEENVTILIGGTGFFEDSGNPLDDEIEHIMPDYDLYTEYVNEMISQGRSRTYYDDYLNYSIGFTTRGCFRKCEFCVNKKYDKAFKHSPVEEFYDPSRPMIYLWDDNFFAYFEGWDEILDELIKTERPFQFRQGLDIRLIKDKQAEKLSHCKYHGDFIFAFDHPEPDQQELVKSKLTLWRKYCNKTTKLYVLCAFDPQNKWDGKSDITPLEIKDIEGIFQRIHILMYFGCLPYIMRYEFYKKSQFRGLYTQIARWCNQPQFFKKMSFKEFCYANQHYAKDPTKTCAALSAYISFITEYPNFEKYFNLKFEEENHYKWVSAYYHKDTKPCALCNKMRTWDGVCSGDYSNKSILKSYFSGELDQLCFVKDRYVECRLDKNECMDSLMKIILESSFKDMLEIIDGFEPVFTINDIPQFSDISQLKTIVNCVANGASSYLELGENLDYGFLKNDVSNRKFGETHAKLAAMLDLIWINTKGNSLQLKPTPLGIRFASLDDQTQLGLVQKLLFRLPIIQKILRDAKSKQVSLDNLMQECSDKTKKRRCSDVRELIEILEKVGDEALKSRLKKVRNN